MLRGCGVCNVVSQVTLNNYVEWELIGTKGSWVHNRHNNMGDQGNNQYIHGQFRGAQPGPGRQAGVRREFNQYCGRWHTPGYCWSEGQSSSCSNCGGNHPSDEWWQPDKVIRLPLSTINPHHYVSKSIWEHMAHMSLYLMFKAQE